MADTQPQTETKKPEITFDQIREVVEKNWNMTADRERSRIAKARGLLSLEGNITAKSQKLIPDSEVGAAMSIDDLRKLVPLAGDSIKYAKDKKGAARMANDRNGFISFGKQRGRRNPHMSKANQAVKSASISIFRKLFSLRVQAAELEHMAKLNAAANEEERAQIGEFHGVPEEEIAKIGAKATVLAASQVRRARREQRRMKRNESKLQRRINAGTLPGNTNRRAYCIN